MQTPTVLRQLAVRRWIPGLLVWILFESPAVFSRQSEEIPPKPPAVPASWKAVIGEYAAGVDTLSIFEKDNRLLLSKHDLGLLTLKRKSGDSYAVNGVTHPSLRGLVFKRDRHQNILELRWGAIAYRRLKLGSLTGPSFTIKPLKPTATLRKIALASTPPEEQGDFLPSDLVELSSLDKTIRYDIRYASKNNFMQSQFYSLPKAFLQRPAAEALVRAHRWLKQRGYGLLIHDAYRPWYVTKMFWDGTPDDKKIFVADPAKGSRHNRGCAIDLTLFDLKTSKPIEMTGGYDEMSERSYPSYAGGTSLQRWHRELLHKAMEMQGFTVFEWEWWHFDYKEWKKYPIGTQTFEEILKRRQ
ncbi:MAG: M15 family metallopeptidase [Bacteroidota bacterium]